MIKIRKKEYKRKKIKWLEGLNQINRESMIQQQIYNEALLALRHKEFRIFKERARVEMEIGRLRIAEYNTKYAIDKVKAEELDEIKINEWKKANEEDKKQEKED